ncbi:MAG: hypothetical protein KAJ91_02355, partial [Candidatus Aenigmarchaeota archaeon]|nr:hypothetical protein [Candidatus Aenigmarchaeota archaeon]
MIRQRLRFSIILAFYLFLIVNTGYVFASTEITVVASGDLNRGSERELARTLDGALHAVYYRSDSQYTQIYYSYSGDNGETWTEEALTSESYNQTNPAIAIDSNDYLHVAWSSGGYRHGSCWHSAYTRYTTFWQPVETFECYAQDPSIAVDSEGNVHYVSNYDPYSSGIKYRNRTASGWSSPTIIAPATYTPRKRPSIAVDSNDYLHVVWDDNGNIRYRNKTSDWQDTETIISDTDSANPKLIWAYHPEVSGAKTNILENGYAFVWEDGPAIKFYKSEPLTCTIELQKDGVEIENIDVGELFDIVFTDYVGNIDKVRFLNDESQNGQVDEGFGWTDPPFSWTESGTWWVWKWDHSEKVMQWSFSTQGIKEVWAEIKNNEGQVSKCSANISAGKIKLINIRGIPGDFTFKNYLEYGMESDEVKYLQIILAEEGPEVYPESKVSGKFYELTKNAVIKFQEKYCTEILEPVLKCSCSKGECEGSGFVGSSTQAKLNDLLNEYRKVPKEEDRVSAVFNAINNNYKN